jgi:cysteinyl-tRNA synthetase
MSLNINNVKEFINNLVKKEVAYIIQYSHLLNFNIKILNHYKSRVLILCLPQL